MSHCLMQQLYPLLKTNKKPPNFLQYSVQFQREFLRSNQMQLNQSWQICTLFCNYKDKTDNKERPEYRENRDFPHTESEAPFLLWTKRHNRHKEKEPHEQRKRQAMENHRTSEKVQHKCRVGVDREGSTVCT